MSHPRKLSYPLETLPIRYGQTPMAVRIMSGFLISKMLSADLSVSSFVKDGTKFWVSLNTRRVTGPDGQTLLYSGFLEDITGRKVAEQALEERLKFEMMLADLRGGSSMCQPSSWMT